MPLLPLFWVMKIFAKAPGCSTYCLDSWGTHMMILLRVIITSRGAVYTEQRPSWGTLFSTGDPASSWFRSFSVTFIFTDKNRRKSCSTLLWNWFWERVSIILEKWNHTLGMQSPHFLINTEYRGKCHLSVLSLLLIFCWCYHSLICFPSCIPSPFLLNSLSFLCLSLLFLLQRKQI